MAVQIRSDQDPKRCDICGVEKPLTEYYARKSTARSSARSLYANCCKPCQIERATAHHKANRPRILARKKDWRNRGNRDPNANWRERSYARNYGTTQAAYDAQFASQNGRCAVCLRFPAEGEQRFAFDHDHATGYARGVLCPRCNGGLGCFQDNVELMKAAIAYLRQWVADETGEETA